MQAVVYRNYGSPDVLEQVELEPPAPGDDEVLVHVRAAAVNPLDWHSMRGTPYFLRIGNGFRKPQAIRLGADLAGQVEAVGRKVTEFQPGDQVFGAAKGALAESVCARATALAPKPANLTFEQAAAVPVAAITALQGLRDRGRIQPRQKVLINGAAGGVGTFAVQIAKSYGADVTAVCSTRNVDLVRSIGADHVVDYTKEDFTQGGQRYNLLLDLVGNRPLSACRRVMTRTGTCVMVGGASGRWIRPLPRVLGGSLLSLFVSQKLSMMLASMKREDLLVLKGLIEAEKVRPVIDRCYPLSQVPKAIRYLERGHARGKVVITLEHDNPA